MSLEVKQLGPEHANSLRALLARDPLQNLHLLSQLEALGIRPSRESVFYGYFHEMDLRAALFVEASSGRVVPDACSAPDAAALAAALAGRVSLQSCLGPRSVVEALVRGLCPARPRLARPHRLFAASADNLGPFVTSALRIATERDLPHLLPLAAGEIQETVERDPLSDTDAFRSEVLARIRAQSTWVLELDGKLVLKVDVAARSSFGAELQGLYTAPEERFRGYATLALGQLSRHLLSSLPRLTLRVATSADSLMAVARKVGYVDGQVEQLLVLN